MVVRTAHEAHLEGERKAFRSATSEREGVMVKLQAEYDGVLNRVKILEVHMQSILFDVLFLLFL